MKNKYFYIYDSPLSKVGSTKARSDIGEILCRLGYRNRAAIFIQKLDGFSIKLENKKKYLSLMFRQLTTLLSIIYTCVTIVFIPKNSILIINYPQAGRLRDSMTFKVAKMMKNYKNIHLIAVIHDLYSLMTGKKETNYLQTVEVLKYYDVVISHNKIMTKYLIEKGISSKKIVNLQLFDYLLNNELEMNCRNRDTSIIIAGNLEKEKISFLKELNFNNNISFNLYGMNFPESFNKINNVKINYFGSFEPNKLIKELVGDFGLVWDSNSSLGGQGILGNYQRYNNPHKTSLYLAAGFPVIVWKEAALAPLILENNLGFVVDNLNELPDKISKISKEDYDMMKTNVEKIGMRIRSGYFLTEALKKAETIIEEEERLNI